MASAVSTIASRLSAALAGRSRRLRGGAAAADPSRPLRGAAAADPSGPLRGDAAARSPGDPSELMPGF
jgi:hypothetical protein